MTTLSPDDLADLASRAFGPRWQSALARDRGVAIRTVQRWASDGIAKPATAEAIRAYLQSRTVVSVPARPKSGNTGILEKGVSAVVEDIVRAGEAVGWTEREMRSAVRQVLFPERTRVNKFNKVRRIKPFTYDTAIDPFLITGHRWMVGADFNFVAIRTGDGSVRDTPITDEVRAQAISEIVERADEIEAHGLQSTAFVVGLLMLEGATDAIDTVTRIGDVLGRAQTDEERQDLQAIMEGRARTVG